MSGKDLAIRVGLGQFHPNLWLKSKTVDRLPQEDRSYDLTEG